MHIPHLDFTSWAAIGVLGATLAACWRQAQVVWRFFRGMVVVDAKLYKEVAEAAMFRILEKHRHHTYRGNRDISSISRWLKPRKRTQDIAVETISFMIFWVGRSPCLLYYSNKSKYQLKNNQISSSDNGENVMGCLHIMFFRWSVNIDQFITEAMEHYAEIKSGEQVENRCQRFRVCYMAGTQDIYKRSGSGYGTENTPGSTPVAAKANDSIISLRSLLIYGFSWQDLMPEKFAEAIDDLAMDQDMEDLVKYCERWLVARDWFLLRRVPWRYGFLVYGEAGCGKTSLIRAIAQKLDLPIFAFDLATMGNSDLKKAWSDMLSSTPCVALIEDADAVFHGRTNITKNEHGVTFDCLLNCIDGVQRADGVILAVTTNDITKIDPALGIPSSEGSIISTRPGRIDRTLRVGRPSEAGRRQIAKRILFDWPHLIEKTVKEGRDDTGAQFQSRCITLAQNIWNKGEDSNILNMDWQGKADDDMVSMANGVLLNDFLRRRD